MYCALTTITKTQISHINANFFSVLFIPMFYLRIIAYCPPCFVIFYILFNVLLKSLSGVCLALVKGPVLLNSVVFFFVFSWNNG